MTVFGSEKSNLPSSGSMRSHCAGTSTVLSPRSLHVRITLIMSASHVAAELLSSPHSRSMGFPPTVICVAVPCFCSFACAWASLPQNMAIMADRAAVPAR